MWALCALAWAFLHHVTATRDSASGSMRLYVDGTLQASATGPTGTRTAPPALRIGSIQSGVAAGFLSGALDDVRLYDVVLSAAQIAALANPNTAPMLTEISNRTIIAGTTLVVNNSAFDPDSPPQVLTYSLLNPPSGATINPANGIISWRPAIAQSPSTNALAVQVADNGSPSLAAIQSFTVTLLRPTQPIMNNSMIGDGWFRSTIAGDLRPDYSVYASTNLVNWNLILTTNPPALPFTFSDTAMTNYNQRFYRIQLGP